MVNQKLMIKRMSEFSLILFVAASFYLLAKIILFVLSLNGEGADDATLARYEREVVTDPITDRKAINIGTMSSWNLFGAAVIAPAGLKKGVHAENAPDTTLQIRLEGVFRSDIEALSAAIISEGGKEGVLYRVGQTLPQGAEIVAVEATRVLLRLNGKIEALRFPKTEGDKAIVLSHLNAEEKKSYVFPPKKGEPRGSSSLPQPLSGDPSQVITQLQAQLKNDSGELLKSFGLQSLGKEEGGGYRVTAQTPKEFVQMLGLKKGDIVRAINGQVLGDISQDQLLLDQVMAEKSVRVEIQRGSRQFTVNFDLPK